MFQSTRPYGARPQRKRRRLPPHGFNPRARTGRDEALAAACDKRRVSIHAPVRGATRGSACALARGILFQSTRPYGARRHSCRTSGAGAMFQSTRPYGARPLNSNSFGFYALARKVREPG